MSSVIMIALLASLISATAAFVTLSRFRRSRDDVRQLLDDLRRWRRELVKDRPTEVPEYLRELAVVSPASAIVVSWHEVEEALRQQGESRRLEVTMGGLIGSLQQLRNAAVHGPADAIDGKSALEVAALAWALSRDIVASRGRPTVE